MQAALDIAAYAFGVTILVGILLLGMLAYDLRIGDRFRIPHPEYVRLPCAALAAAREVYPRMKIAYASVSAKERRYLEIHLRRMEERVQYLEQKVFEEQAPYYKAVSRREKVWRKCKALHDQVLQMRRSDRSRARLLLAEAAQAYRFANDGTKDEWERGVQHDNLMLAELRSLGVLDEGYIPKLVEQARAYAAKVAPQEEPEAWQEPGVAEPAPGDGSGEESPAAAGADGPGEPGAERPAQPEPAPHGIGSLSYDLIRKALAPLFGSKIARLAVQVPDTAPIPESAWTPAPPPPREAAPRPRETSPAPPLPDAQPGLAGASPAGLRQEDLLGSTVAATGRRYLDPIFAVTALPGGILRGVDLSRTGFTGVRFIGRHRYLDCRFAEADMTVILLEPQERPHQFVRCDFKGARFDSSRLGFALFHQCDLTATRWNGARLERVRFSDCLLDGVEWGGAEFADTRIVSMAIPAEPDAGAVAEPMPSPSGATAGAHDPETPPAPPSPSALGSCGALAWPPPSAPPPRSFSHPPQLARRPPPSLSSFFCAGGATFFIAAHN
ncbi:MAG: pentapeptide repeat-containing protein, partial [SAR324 cluster bacterium]